MKASYLKPPNTIFVKKLVKVYLEQPEIEVEPPITFPDDEWYY